MGGALPTTRCPSHHSIGCRNSPGITVSKMALLDQAAQQDTATAASPPDLLPGARGTVRPRVTQVRRVSWHAGKVGGEKCAGLQIRVLITDSVAYAISLLLGAHHMLIICCYSRRCFCYCCCMTLRSCIRERLLLIIPIDVEETHTFVLQTVLIEARRCWREIATNKIKYNKQHDGAS